MMTRADSGESAHHCGCSEAHAAACTLLPVVLASGSSFGVMDSALGRCITLVLVPFVWPRAKVVLSQVVHQDGTGRDFWRDCAALFLIANLPREYQAYLEDLAAGNVMAAEEKAEQDNEKPGAGISCLGAALLDMTACRQNVLVSPGQAVRSLHRGPQMVCGAFQACKHFWGGC